eukprot:274902_1
MSTVDWSVDPTALRKILLKLSKPKLIKLCKQKKITINRSDNKKDIIDRLLKASKLSQKKKKDTNKKNVKPKKKVKKQEKTIKSAKKPDKMLKIISKPKNNSNALEQSYTTSSKTPTNIDDIKSPQHNTTRNNAATHRYQSSNFVYNDDTIYLSWKSQQMKNRSVQQRDYEEEENDYEEESPTITIDHGSHTIFAGFSGREYPTHIIDSKVGIPDESKIGLLEYSFCKTMNNKNNTVPIDVVDIISKYFQKNYYIADDMYSFSKILDFIYPIQNGMITDFNAMEQIWRYLMYNALRAPPEECPILLTDIYASGAEQKSYRTCREKITQFMFEDFNIPVMYLSPRETLTLYSYGKTTGMVLNCGHDINSVASIYEGYILPHALARNKVAGKEITNYLDQLFKKRGYFLPKYIVQDIKEKLGIVAFDYDRELQRFDNDYELKTYELPDGTCIEIGSERLECTKILFEPDLIVKSESDGIHKLASISNGKCDTDIMRDLMGNICTSGGTSMLNGFYSALRERGSHNRFDFSVGEAHCFTKIHSHEDEHNMFSAWVGGSILSSADFDWDNWISKYEYDEWGCGIVHRKCF